MRPAPSLREVALAAAAYAALGVWWLWPIARAAATATPTFAGQPQVVSADFSLITWALAWDAHAIATAPSRLFHANILHPSPSSLAYSESFLGLVPLHAPVFWATANAVLARNLLLVALQPVCALSMYALARRFFAAPGALVAGFFYGFTPERLADLAHLHILGVECMPLAFLFAERWLERASAIDAVALAAALAIQGATSFYLGYAMAFAYAVWIPLALWAWRDRLDARRWIGLAAATAAAATALALLAIPLLRARASGFIPADAEDYSTLPFGLWPNVTAQAVRTFFARRSVGWVGYALIAIAVLPPWRGRKRVTLAGVLLVAAGTLLAHGPRISIGATQWWSPYSLLVAVVPGFGAVRLPVRFLVVAQTGLAVLAGLGAARLLDRAPQRAAIAGAMAIAAAALASFALPALDVAPDPIVTSPHPADAWLASHGEGRPLFEHPGGDFVEIGRRMVRSTVHWLPIVDGYSGYPPATVGYLHGLAAAGLTRPATLQRLLDTVDLGWILVHLDQLPPHARAHWDATPPGLDLAGRFGDDLLFRVMRTGDRARQARFLSTSETLDGTPLAPLGDACPGEIALAKSPPEPWPARGRVDLTVTLRNDGSRAWPGLAFVPKHAVAIVACLASRGRDCSAPARRLPGDVPAGGSLDVPVTLDLRRAEGQRDLVVSLVQRGDLPLARCGVAPLRVPVHIAGPPG
ncbi:MAG TPA: hypothetical protein VFD92_20770 [Candidatus Binatia bacterium]|nr:hypothetical protein [Candidatus Binatia bacterium]